MRRTSRKPLEPAPFPHWAAALEGYCNTTLLPRGGLYRPHALAELALVAAPPTAGQAPGDPGICADIIPMIADAPCLPCRADRSLYATQSLMLIELDMIAFRSLLARSEPFRALFRQASTARLRRLHKTSARTAPCPTPADPMSDPLLSAWPVAPLH